MDEISAVDAVCLAILVIAVLRGTFIGMIREGFSIAALAAACVAVAYGNEAAASWLIETAGGIAPWLETAAPWISGGVIFIATTSLIGFAGRMVKRGARAVGLDWADRLGGGALGAAEGTLVVAILVTALVLVLGRSHPTLKESVSLEVVDTMRGYLDENFDELPAVGAPPKI